jgi:hypothetical protein
MGEKASEFAKVSTMYQDRVYGKKFDPIEGKWRRPPLDLLKREPNVLRQLLAVAVNYIGVLQEKPLPHPRPKRLAIMVHAASLNTTPLKEVGYLLKS